MEMSDTIALWALGVAVLALIVAIVSAAFAKFQADAAHGNLKPEFEMTGQRLVAGDMGRGLDINVRNHNRHTIHIGRFIFWAPKALNISHQANPNGPFGSPSRVVKFDHEVAVRNMAVDRDRPTRFHFAHRAKKGRMLPKRFNINCWIVYRVGAGWFPRFGYCRLPVDG